MCNLTIDSPALLPTLAPQRVPPDVSGIAAEVAAGHPENSAADSNSLGMAVIFVLALGLLVGGIWLIRTRRLFLPGGPIFSLQPGATVINHLPLRNFNPQTQTAHLVVLEGPEDLKRRLPISKVKTKIGRNWPTTSTTNDININDLTISRTHAEIIYDLENRQAGYQICDVSNRNRVGINGLEIEKNKPVTLKNNDIIEIGDVVLRFELTGNGQAGIDYDGQKTESIVETE